MSLFSFLKSELIDIIEWNQESQSDVIAWRFPRHDNEIKNGAKLIVREGQMAVLVNLGQLADVFTPGLHTLETKNIPILSTIMGWKYGFNSPFKCEVYFISTRRFTDLKWGTQNPVIVRDREFGPTRLRAFGTYALQVTKAPEFLRQVISTDPSLQTYEIAQHLRNVMVTRASDALASSQISVLDMAANLDELSAFVKGRLEPEFLEMGISLPSFLIENVSLPPEVETMLDKRTSMGVVGDLNAFTKFQTAQAIPEAAKNPGGVAGAGAGLAAGMMMAQQMMSAQGAMAEPIPATAPIPGMPSSIPPTAPLQAPPPLPQAAAPPFFAAIGGQQVGPMDATALRARILAGEVTRETLIWRPGMSNWVGAAYLPEVASMLAAVPPPLPPA